jgi:methionyl-tRNA formyltransferase
VRLRYLSSGPRERVLGAVLDAGHTVDEVIVTDPRRWPRVAATLALADERGLPVRVVGRGDLEPLAGEVRGETLLSVGFGLILPRAVLDATALCLNVHGTLLPKYAGMLTLNWALVRGERESGVTVHQMDEGVDTGPILLQRRFPLSRFETARSLYRKTLELEPEVVVEALALVEAGRATFTPQDLSEAEALPDRRPEHSELDATRPLIELFDAIRAADPERGFPAHFYVDGQKVCVRLWRPDRGDDDPDTL